jgi:hypothetical protein
LIVAWLRRIALALLGSYGARLRFPHLLVLSGALLVLDLLIPDVLPFYDELMLAVATLLFASWKQRRDPAETTPQIDE